MANKKTRGKKNRESGQRFELKVRKDLESKGWIVDRWSNNVELPTLEEAQAIHMGHNKWIKRLEPTKGKIISAKHKFRGVGIPMAIGTGFPDFIVYSPCKYQRINVLDINGNIFNTNAFIIFGVECKSNGFLTKEEKEKCKWLLENNVFGKILIAKKGKKRGEIIYEDFRMFLNKETRKLLNLKKSKGGKGK